MRMAQKGLIALFISIMELAFLPILLDVGGGSVGIVQLMVYTFMVGSASSLLVSYKADRWKGLSRVLHSRKALAITAGAGVLNFGVAQLLLTIGTIGTNPSVGSVLFRSYVLMFALMVPFAVRNRIDRYQLLAALLGIAGVFILATGGSGFQLNASQLPFILVLLGSAFAAAVSNLMIKIYSVSTIDSVAVFNLASLALSAAIALSFGIPVSFQLSWIVLASVLFLGVVTYSIGGILFYYSFKTLNAVKTTNMTLVIPFLTILLSFLLLGTPIKGYYVYAYALLALGILLQQRYSSNAPEYIKSEAGYSRYGTVFDVTGAFVHNRSDAIYGAVSGGKRALAIKVERGAFLSGVHDRIFERHGCMAFTSSKPHPSAGNEEIEFINEITKPSGPQELLICLGEPENAENALDEFSSTIKPMNAK
jgi:drug/metabolite transporter (DMT)-like permease